jgi:hypothetical protein
MLRHAALIVVLGLLVATATATDQPTKASPPNLSDDAKKFIAYCNQQMEKDYRGEVLQRGHAMRGLPTRIDPFDQKAVKRLLDEQWRATNKFVRGYLVPRSRKRLIAYIDKHSPSELRKLNELTTLDRRLTKAEDARILEIQDSLIKIEDAVLKEIPEKRFPKFD